MSVLQKSRLKDLLEEVKELLRRIENEMEQRRKEEIKERLRRAEEEIKERLRREEPLLSAPSYYFDEMEQRRKVLIELQQADLITSAECKRLFWNDMSAVVNVQKGKSPEVMSKTAVVLRRHGFEKQSRLLAVLGELQQADLITSEECKRLPVEWYDMSDVVAVQKGKSPEVMSKTAKVLRRHGFEKESRLLAANAALTELQQADLISSEECEELKYVWMRYDTCGVVRVQKGKSPKVMCETADILRRHGFYEESRLFAECLRHHDAKTELLSLVHEEWSRLSSAYQSLKKLVRAVAKCLPKQSRHFFRQKYKSVSLSASQIGRWPWASKVLDARDLRRQIEALHDPKLLQQLSSYEEDKLIVNFLVQCQRKGVQPDSSLPDVRLSPSTPADQVLRFILSRKDYYIKDLHIDREHFSPWDVDTPPPARVPPTLDEPDHFQSLEALLNIYSKLFTKFVENAETLPQQQYLNLKSYFQYQPHTDVHLPSSRSDVRDRLHRTPLFAPLCTALLRKVVWFLFTDDAEDLSRMLGYYERKLGTFVSQFLLACHVEGVVAPTGGMALHEDGCDLSDPAHLLSCVLELKPYYVVSLHVDESLFTALEREGSLGEEEGREENVSMDASPFEPTPPTSESESPGSPQSKGKGKHRVGTSPSAVPAKRSAQGEGSEYEEKEVDEEESAGSSAKRRRREDRHMTGASQSGTGAGTDSGGSDVMLSQMVYDRPNHLMLFRKNVSRVAAGKGRAVLEGVWLDAATIEACFRSNPLDEEAAVQAGLTKWVEGKGRQPPTWEALIEAMEDAEIGQEHFKKLKTDLGLLKW